MKVSPSVSFAFMKIVLLPMNLNDSAAVLREGGEAKFPRLRLLDITVGNVRRDQIRTDVAPDYLCCPGVFALIPSSLAFLSDFASRAMKMGEETASIGRTQRPRLVPPCTAHV